MSKYLNHLYNYNLHFKKYFSIPGLKMYRPASSFMSTNNSELEDVFASSELLYLEKSKIIFMNVSLLWV